MRPGPKTKPAELSAMQGNPGHRALPETSQSAPVVSSDAPEFLVGDEARLIWEHVSGHLRPMNFVRETDRNALARYCDYMARWIKLRDLVDAEGESYLTESNHGKMVRQNPNFRAMLAIDDRLVKLEDRIGLNPAARQSIMQNLAAAGRLALNPDGASGTAQQPGDDGGPMGMFAPAAPSSSAIN